MKKDVAAIIVGGISNALVALLVLGRAMTSDEETALFESLLLAPLIISVLVGATCGAVCGRFRLAQIVLLNSPFLLLEGLWVLGTIEKYSPRALQGTLGFLLVPVAGGAAWVVGAFLTKYLNGSASR